MPQSKVDFPAKLIYQPVVGFVEQVASKAPAPGGGSVAALSGTLGAALLTMVANLTIGKKKYLEVSDAFVKLREKTEDLRGKLSVQIDADTEAFTKLRVAGRLPDTDEQLAAIKKSALAEATHDAIEVPQQTMLLCLETLKLAPQIVRDGNTNTVSDAATGAELLLAGLEGAANNVLINISGRSDSHAELYRDAVAKGRGEGHSLLDEVRKTVDGKLRA